MGQTKQKAAQKAQLYSINVGRAHFKSSQLPLPLKIIFAVSLKSNTDSIWEKSKEIWVSPRMQLILNTYILS